MDTLQGGEETLSLSDLPLHGDYQSDHDWEQDLSSQESTSFSSSEDDFFEFFSQEYFNPSPPESIIFCGKLIQPYRDAKSSFESRKQEAHIKKEQDCGVSRWNFADSERCIEYSRNDKTRPIPLTIAHKKDRDRHISSPLHYSSKKALKGLDFQVQKFPVMGPSSSGKAKWYLFFLGTSRFSSAMELNGKSSRRQYPFRRGDKNISHDRERGWRNMGGLIGALSCGGTRQADTMVAASIGRAALKRSEGDHRTS